jgi:gliding motility-associated-like protein
VNATGTITVNANNTVTAASATPSICINTLMPSITHSTTGATGIGVAIGLPSGVNALWAGNTITISGTPTASGIFNYTIPLTGGCETINAIGTITVLPNKTVSSASISPVLCVNTVMPDITHTTTEVTGIGTAIGLPTGVTASWTANTITISGTPSTMGVYNYIIPLIGSCGSVNAIGTISVNPTPTNISISGSASTCAGFPVNLTLTATPGTQISWSGSPNPILIHSSGSNVIPVSPSVTTTYEIFSANLNGCSIPVVGQSAFVTVASTPQFVTQILDIEICNGGIMSIASQLTSTVPNTNFIWSATGINVNIAANSGNQTNIDQIVNLINTSQNGSISLVITPRIGNCDGVSQQINIIVKAIPVLTSAIANKNILCNNEMVTITLNSNLSATIYNWQVNTANGVQIVGGITNGTSTTGILHLQLLLTDPLVAGTLSFNFTPINGTCSGTTFVNAVTLAVNPIPGVPVGTIIDRCSGTPANLFISTSPAIANTTLIWTVVEFQNVTGFANGSALSPYVINDVLVNNSEVQGYVKYRVTSQLGNCNGGTEEFIVRVNPLPKIYMNDGYVCVNQSTGVTYQGYVLDAGIYNSNLSYEWFKLNETTNIFESLAITAGSTYGITQPGAYQVVVTNTLTNCTQSDSVTVIPVFPATGVSTVVTDAFAENATITVSLNATGTGNLMYSLDGGPWQTSPIFEGVDSGSHEIKIIDSEGCTDLTTEVFVIDYPKYFTPNGDGYHDTWFIEGIDQWEATLSIYDRFGKLISQFTPGSDNQGWDGTYLGLVLPSTDYWFTIKYKENDQQKLFRAHFALKR